MRLILALLAFAAVAVGQTPDFVFIYKVGGFVPAPQTLYLTTQNDPVQGLAALITGGEPWLVASMSSQVSPATLTVSVNPLAMAVGEYFGTIQITSSSTQSWLGTSLVNVTLIVRQPISITSITNAAIPSLDLAASTVSLAPRSMATMAGTNLADGTTSTAPPWTNALSGTEVHLASQTCFDSSCDLVAGLISVSPSQINFLVPDTADTGPVTYRVILLRDGQRIDNRYAENGPWRLIIDPSGTADYDVVFQVGYDCLFSASLSDPAACGLSWNSGEDRGPVGNITDALTGQLISPENPVYQGRLITLWMTALDGGVSLDSGTGLWTAKIIAPIAFGVAQSGNVLTSSFVSAMPLWAGEAPGVMGLDQVNVVFPTCANAPASSEKRYDAFLSYLNATTGNTARIYLPFVIRPGDPDCEW